MLIGQMNVNGEAVRREECWQQSQTKTHTWKKNKTEQ